MNAIFLSSLICTIISYLVTYIVGHVVMSAIKIPQRYIFLKEFSKLCAGFFSIFVVYSIVRSHGITINTGFVFLFIILTAWLKKHNHFRRREEMITELTSFSSVKYLVLQILVLLFCFVFLFVRIKDPFSIQSYETNADFYNYAILMEHLNKTGVEGGFPDWFSGVPPVRTLYHYGELWFGAFFSLLTGQKSFLVFYFQLYVDCLVIYFLGACALIEVFLKPTGKWIYGFAILILFICGISFYLPRTTIFTKGDWWDIGLIGQPKYFFTAIFVFYTMLFYQLRKPFIIILVGMAAILACSVAAPAILLSVSLFILVLFLLKRISFMEAVKFSLPILMTLIFIGAYTVFIHHLNDKYNIAEAMPVSAYVVKPWFGYVRTAFNAFAGQFIKSILSLFAYLVLFFLYKFKRLRFDKNLQGFILLLLIIHLSSIASYAIFCYLGVDTVQLWSIMYAPLTAIACFLLVITVIHSNKHLLQIMIIPLFILSFIQTRMWTRAMKVNEQNLSKVKKMYDGSLAVTFMSQEVLSRDWNKNINLYPPFAYLKMYYDNYNTVCLSVFEVPKSKDPHFQNAVEEIKRNSVFYRFVQLQKKNNKFISIERSKLDFMNKYKVKYVFTYDGTQLPDTLQQLIAESSHDSIYDITLHRLK